MGVLTSAAGATILAVLMANNADAQECHPSHNVACVPVASDPDCAGGSSDGPEYVVGTFEVIGPEVHGLDRDKVAVAWRHKKVEAIQKALAAQGIQFLEAGQVAAGPGVVLKPGEC